MKIIWKYQLSGPGLDTTLQIPLGWEFLSCQLQGGVICMWCLVDEGRTKEECKFTVLGTGWEVPNNTSFRGTIQSPPFVWHVFEATKSKGD